MRRQQAVSAVAGVAVSLLAGLAILAIQGYPAVESYSALFSYSLFSQFALVSTVNRAATLFSRSRAVGFGSNCVNLGQPAPCWGMAAAAASSCAYLRGPCCQRSRPAAVAGAECGLAALLPVMEMNEFITTRC